MQFELGDQEISFKLERGDFAKQLHDENLVDSLVRFDDKTKDLVKVDVRVDDTYAIFAGVHECICCGKYQHLAPAGAKGVDRCGLIDIMLMQYMPAEYVETYRKKRIAMHKELLKRNFSVDLHPQFRRAIEILSK